jgi:hypothetical protein
MIAAIVASPSARSGPMPQRLSGEVSNCAEVCVEARENSDEVIRVER